VEPWNASSLRDRGFRLLAFLSSEAWTEERQFATRPELPDIRSGRGRDRNDRPRPTLGDVA
jgi:hypothetical protein